MKKLIISVLCVAIFFIGLGGLIQETGARFKSDERALVLIKQAQTAIGGEDAVKNVRSLSIVGSVSKTFDIDGASKIEQGELEINLALPNQFSKMMKLRHEDNSTESKTGEVKKQVNVIVMREDGENAAFKQIDPNENQPGVLVLKRGDGDKQIVLNEGSVNSEVRKVIVDKDMKIGGGGINFHQNELFRTTLALLLTAPQGTDVTFIYAGDGDVDGNNCDIVEARTGNSAVKLFLDKSSHLPRMMSYQGFKPVIFKFNKDDKNEAETNGKIIVNKFDKPEMAEIQVRFADYRSVNGVLLPYKWTQTIGGNADETIDISSYEINPANIAEKFKDMPTKVMIRTKEKAQ